MIYLMWVVNAMKRSSGLFLTGDEPEKSVQLWWVPKDIFLRLDSPVVTMQE
jgi:hypothetical protein